MPNRNLLLRLLRRNRAFLLSCTILFGAFEFLIAALVSTLDIQGILSQVMGNLPPIMQSVVGQQMLGGMTRLGVLAFGWNHPIVLALGGAVALVLASRAIAGEVESGAIELVLAQPISRASYTATQALLGFGGLAILTAGGLAGSLIGQLVYHLGLFSLVPALALAVNYWLLNAATFAVALAISAFSREGGRVGSLGFLLLLGSFLIEIIGDLWQPASFLPPFSIYSRFDPRSLLQNGVIPAMSLAVLGGLLVLGTATAWGRFRRRDLP